MIVYVEKYVKDILSSFGDGRERIGVLIGRVGMKYHRHCYNQYQTIGDTQEGVRVVLYTNPRC